MWWQRKCIYEVYIPSFCDSNGDGIGDIPGVLSKLDYIVDLGIDIIWLTPFYPSPMKDHGYDIQNYKNVDVRFGTLADIDSLVAAAHARGLRILIDLVVNHTSGSHPWFMESRSNRVNRYRDYYVWRDPAVDGGPPNNWLSHFGGSAWTYDEQTGQYRLHLFLPEQPDLNWANLAVADEVDEILRFWLRRGVDGFRVDVAHGLAKDPLFRDNPLRSSPSNSPGIAVREYHSTTHEFDHDRPEVLNIYRRWNSVVTPFDAVLIGEVNINDAAKVARYSKDGDGLDVAMWFGLVECGWDIDKITALLREPTKESGKFGWVQSSHDRPRSTTRFGGGTIGARRALVLATLMAGLPEVFVVYQGEELGLPDGEVPAHLARDPITHRDPMATGRDGSRTPLPWSPGLNLGFTTGTPWLPMGQRSESYCASVQAAISESWLNRWRRLLAARRHFVSNANMQWLQMPIGMIAYRHGEVLVIGNLAADIHTVATEYNKCTLLYSTTEQVQLAGADISIGPEAAVIVGVE